MSAAKGMTTMSSLEPHKATNQRDENVSEYLKQFRGKISNTSAFVLGLFKAAVSKP